MPIYKKHFHKTIKELKLSKGYTQQYVADNTGISQVNIARIENGNREPNLENLGILIDFYEVNADSILGTGKKIDSQSS